MGTGLGLTNPTVFLQNVIPSSLRFGLKGPWEPGWCFTIFIITFCK